MSDKKTYYYVFTRRAGEMIRVGEDTYVRVEKVLPEKAFLEVIAPRNVSVHRSEVYEAIRSQFPKGD